MNKISINQFLQLPLSQRFLLAGNLLVLIGGTALGIGGLLELLAEGKLPKQMNTNGAGVDPRQPTNSNSTSTHGRYFRN